MKKSWNPGTECLYDNGSQTVCCTLESSEDLEKLPVPGSSSCFLTELVCMRPVSPGDSNVQQGANHCSRRLKSRCGGIFGTTEDGGQRGDTSEQDS